MNTWAKLSSINVNEHVEKKSGLSYLSWAWAWGLTKEQCPDATYRVINFDGKPYCFDENLGYMVQTEVTISGESLPMHLFVMDGANKAQKHIDYTYTTKSGSKTCVAASMFDINTAIMRCLTKNLAMFGLGHYIYSGEDLPHESEEVKREKIENYKMEIANVLSIEELTKAWQSIPKELKNDLKPYATSAKTKLTEVSA
jgi:hypothetical protein